MWHSKAQHDDLPTLSVSSDASQTFLTLSPKLPPVVLPPSPNDYVFAALRTLFPLRVWPCRCVEVVLGFVFPVPRDFNLAVARAFLPHAVRTDDLLQVQQYVFRDRCLDNAPDIYANAMAAAFSRETRPSVHLRASPHDTIIHCLIAAAFDSNGPVAHCLANGGVFLELNRFLTSSAVALQVIHTVASGSSVRTIQATSATTRKLGTELASTNAVVLQLMVLHADWPCIATEALSSPHCQRRTKQVCICR